MNIKSIIKQVLKESPDVVFLPGDGKVTYDEGPTITFGWLKNKPVSIFTERNEHWSKVGTHGILLKSIIYFEDYVNYFTPQEMEDLKESYEENKSLLRKVFQYPGRLWNEDKIISFWDYPSKFQIKNILKQLQDHINKTYKGIKSINFFDGEWEIDLPNGKLININDYVGVEEKHKDHGKDHVMSPLLKSKKSNSPYNPKYKKLKKMTPAERNFILQREELVENILKKIKKPNQK